MHAGVHQVCIHHVDIRLRIAGVLSSILRSHRAEIEYCVIVLTPYTL
jgi:hypothetical protein